MKQQQRLETVGLDKPIGSLTGGEGMGRWVFHSQIEKNNRSFVQNQKFREPH